MKTKTHLPLHLLFALIFLATAFPHSSPLLFPDALTDPQGQILFPSPFILIRCIFGVML